MLGEQSLLKSKKLGEILYKIGVDLMGAEITPEEIFHAILELVTQESTNMAFVLYATQDVVDSLQKRYTLKDLPISFKACQEAIFMDEKPLVAVKQKKQATTCVVIDDHAKHLIDACISCASTGAIVTASSLYLAPLPGIDRPCLATCVPKTQGACVLVDVGARVSATDTQLVQYAYLATSYARLIFGKNQPRVGLLNIGREFAKGGDDLQKAFMALSGVQNAPFIFSKNVEPYDLFFGDVDIVITNGFCGNILLKTIEATAAFVMHEMQKSGVQSGVQGSGFDLVKQSLSQDAATGAHLLGLKGYVAKCHGHATKESIKKTALSLQALLNKSFVEETERFLA